MNNLTHEQMMRRCFYLARQAGKATKSNPMVGAVIVHNNQIIGEGYHKKYGEAHAEVNAFNSLGIEDKSKITDARLYVSLEPCCFIGKTGACTDLIKQSGIKHVIISCTDPNPKVNGKGIQILEEAGIQVETGILQEEGQQLLKKFKANTIYQRPYILLKMAESRDGFIGREDTQLWLTNPYSKVLTHKWRSEYDAIMVGTNTAIVDNPKLNTRAYPGDNPLRILIDKHGKIPKTHHVLSDELESRIYTSSKDYTLEKLNKTIIYLPDNESFIDSLLKDLIKQGIYSLMVEGGAKLINYFYQSGIWDECRIIRAKKPIHNGIKSPLIELKYSQKMELDGDEVYIAYNE